MDIDEILERHVPKDCIWEEMGNYTNLPKGYIKSAIKEIVETTIDMCAENAEVNVIDYNNYEVDKESILKLKNKIKY